MAGVYLASTRVSARQMGVGSQRFDVGISRPCLHEVALYWDATKHVAHAVARAENEKHIRFSNGSYRWQCYPVLDGIVDRSVGNRWIKPPNTGCAARESGAFCQKWRDNVRESCYHRCCR